MNPPKPKFELPEGLPPQAVECFERIRLIARGRILQQRKRQAGPSVAPDPQRVDRGCPKD